MSGDTEIRSVPEMRAAMESAGSGWRNQGNTTMLTPVKRQLGPVVHIGGVWFRVVAADEAIGHVVLERISAPAVCDGRNRAERRKAAHEARRAQRKARPA